MLASVAPLYALIALAANRITAMDNTPSTPISTQPIQSTWLGFSSGFWDIGLIIGLAFAALVAFAVVVTTWGSIVTHKREAAEADRALAAYKVSVADEVANANARAAEATERAENARLEQEKLKQLVKWRTIEPEDMKTLIAELAKGGGEIDVAFAPSDPESEYFALAVIGGAFRTANESTGVLKWHLYLRPWISTGMFFGIAIPGPENDQVKFLRNAFSEAHVEFSTGPLPDESPPIAVGSGLAFTPAPKHEALIVVGLRKPPL